MNISVGRLRNKTIWNRQGNSTCTPSTKTPAKINLEHLQKTWNSRHFQLSIKTGQSDQLNLTRLSGYMSSFGALTLMKLNIYFDPIYCSEVIEAKFKSRANKRHSSWLLNRQTAGIIAFQNQDEYSIKKIKKLSCFLSR